jgi:hypothetical protein
MRAEEVEQGTKLEARGEKLDSRSQKAKPQTEAEAQCR